MYLTEIVWPMNKNNRKEHLYFAAFKLFITKQYDAVSISDIEKESGMTRGAITYYSQSKRGLFYDVVKHFIIDTQNIENKVKYAAAKTLKDFIEAYVTGCQDTMNRLDYIDKSVQNASSAYMSLILQICRFFPDLHDKYIENRNKEMALWIKIIQKAIDSHEVKDGISIVSMAKNFMNIFYGQSYLDSLSMGLNTVELKVQMMSLYNLLKI